MSKEQNVIITPQSQSTAIKSYLQRLEDRINWLEIENQYLKQKVKQLEAKQNET